MMQQIQEWYQKYMNKSPHEDANKNDDESGETPDKPDDEDHELKGETLPETDTAAISSPSRREKRTETRKRVREQTFDGEITKTTSHIGPTY